MSLKFFYCLKADISELEIFLNRFWKNGHILSKNRELLDWQYFNEDIQRYNIIVAKDTLINEIVGLLGFIPTNHFDNKIQNIDIWQSIWKVRDDIKAAGVGLMLHKKLLRDFNPRSISGLGLSRLIIPYSINIGFRYHKMNHYYIINAYKKKFKIAVHEENCNNRNNFPTSEYSILQESLEFLDEYFDNIAHEQTIPQKSKDYFINRYLKHPIYKYKIFSIRKSGRIDSFFICRIIDIEETSIMRLVDFWGTPFSLGKIYQSLQQLLNDYNAEYIDFYNYGIETETLVNGGFRLRDGDEIIIPNYFEPYVQKNVDLDFVVKTNLSEKFFVYKGDSDQDRPNLI